MEMLAGTTCPDRMALRLLIPPRLHPYPSGEKETGTLTHAVAAEGYPRAATAPVVRVLYSICQGTKWGD